MDNNITKNKHLKVTPKKTKKLKILAFGRQPLFLMGLNFAGAYMGQKDKEGEIIVLFLLKLLKKH